MFIGRISLYKSIEISFGLRKVDGKLSIFTFLKSNYLNFCRAYRRSLRRKCHGIGNLLIKTRYINIFYAIKWILPNTKKKNNNAFSILQKVTLLKVFQKIFIIIGEYIFFFVFLLCVSPVTCILRRGGGYP